ncbi:MAG TPA: THUMP domain-containing protein [Sulfolobales archaeon]|nr:THUMP domain-containing protein [Sulfolobales archaeon]
MHRYLLRLSGEISLKGSLRGSLERRLIRNIKDTLGSEIIGIERIDGGRIYIEASRDLSEDLTRFFGVVEVLEVIVESSKDLYVLSKKIRDHFCHSLTNKKFAVRVRRTGSTGYTSLDAARVIGSALLDCSSGVDLENPDETIYVEVRGERAFISLSSTKRRGYGGLPLGSSEKVLSLFSGGFDSPVATWMIMRRGSPADIVHYVMGSPDNTIRALKVGEVLVKRWSLKYDPRVFVIDFSEIIAEIRSRIRRRLWQPSLRRAMYLVGRSVAEKVRASAIVTGEAVWEASSQRLSALYASQKGIDLLILRPLIGFDKAEILKLSKDLGLYEYSSKVIESCFIGGGSPLYVDPESLVEEFAKIDRGVFDRALERAIEISYNTGWEEELIKRFKTDLVSIDTIPEGSIIVDITRKKGYGSIRGLDDLEELLRKGERVVLVCEFGEASEALARYLREEGYEVYSLRGGYKKLKQIIPQT